MTASIPKVLLVCNQRTRDQFLAPSDLERLSTFATWDWLHLEGGEAFAPNDAPSAIRQLADRVGDFDSIVVCHGSPTVSADMMDRAPNLRVVGELEGDRFAYRIDVEAAWKRGIRTVDTTNGSSYPVAEWALAMILVSLRNAGAYFRRIIAGDTSRPPESDFGYMHGELTGKRVGLIGCGHIGRLLIKFLRPFEADIRVYDPYLSSELPDALGFVKTSLETILSESDVITCLAPLTPATQGMIGQRELEMIPPNSVFVNVSRGAIVDSDALIARLKRGDIVAGLDVFDPEPIPSDSEIIGLPNVFLTPHIAGVTASSYPRFFTLMVDELERFFKGYDPLYELSPRSLANRRGSAETVR
ncbi:MAG: hydroxyacid dehydrogenase [SAR202 cluster bacterium]|jgi:phosphoglycerate dehydrogenase-like enzyme|nr:hydroxyacid dehydrogenase [SAR202 cluster bacterium]MDP6514448.1 hydroxyacid dehydrogenase [SAR202 cluster bacterium]MDP6713738.1 hydroxyacid dehydrogenase [SAR202 cluster bacterium]